MDQLDQILSILKENKELSEKAILAARQSTPESLSPILQETRNKIDSLTYAVEELRKSQEELKIGQNLHVGTHIVNDKKTEDGLKALQETSQATLEQAKKTNGRVTNLENRMDIIEDWKKVTVSFANGMKAGGKGVWTALAVVAGLIWIIFGDSIKGKLFH